MRLWFKRLYRRFFDLFELRQGSFLWLLTVFFVFSLVSLVICATLSIAGVSMHDCFLLLSALARIG